jgi:hypothetical protein
MAQGVNKKLSKPGGKSAKPKAVQPKRLGHRVVKPKKTHLIARNKMIKVFLYSSFLGPATAEQSRNCRKTLVVWLP